MTDFWKRFLRNRSAVFGFTILLLGIFLLASALVVAVNLIVDVIYCFLDPRIEVK